jgi:carbonic anhydrase
MQRTLRAAAILLLFAAVAHADEWSDLVRGNRRYVAGHLTYSHLRSQRRATRKDQHPPVTIISCSDSRVPPELMFDQTVGDIFVVRVAGNVIDEFNLASVEYAVANKWTKLIVVIGHEYCGAVKEAISKETEFGSPSLNALVAKIRKNLDDRKPPIREAVDINAHASTKQLLDSEIIRNSRVRIVTAYYGFDGRVRKID